VLMIVVQAGGRRVCEPCWSGRSAWRRRRREVGRSGSYTPSGFPGNFSYSHLASENKKHFEKKITKNKNP
jgi:hypothetical protein